MNTQPALAHVPVSALRVSGTIAQRERRAQLDKASIAELAESIATVGVLQPLVVRLAPLAEGLNYLPTDPTHEIVAGERRFLAAKHAKLDTVPVIVRELTDEQVLEVQLVENLQRADVHPMAEAEGYEGLHKLGRTVDEIADKVGKSKAYVYARMKLLDLGQAARKAFYAGKLTASTALYVARVPLAGGLQDEAVKEITSENGWDRQPMSARRALEHIQQNYMLRLSDAPFKTGDATLLPAAGACGACPKRTGNQKELFADVKGADVCTDPGCYRAKVEAHTERAIAKARETGQAVIEGAAAKKIAPDRYTLKGYVKLDDTSFSGPKPQKYRQILGKDYTPTLLVEPSSGTVVEVAPVEDLPKAAKASSSGRTNTYQEQHKAEQRKRDREVRYRSTVLQRLHEHATKNPEDFERDALEIVAERLWKSLSHDAKGKLFKALGWEVKKSKGVGVDYALPTPIGKQEDDALRWTIQLLALAPELEVYSYGSGKPEGLETMAIEFGVDYAAIRKDLQTEARDTARGKKRATKMADNRRKAKSAKKGAKA